jgi:hypothetical protein
MLSEALEKAVWLPFWSLLVIDSEREQIPNKSFESTGRFEVDGLLRVVGRRVITIVQPLINYFLLWCIKLIAHVHCHCWHTLTNKAVLVAADETIALRSGILLGFDAVPFRNLAGPFTEVRLADAVDRSNYLAQ